ncbi:MAG TPA: hypothetical protein PKY30_09890, partial [Myxococcota bacterium]|nr:hypothetical protein [Myxococcota bacterium]
MQLSLLLLLATGCQTVEENDSWEAADSSYSSSGASGSEGQPLRLTAEQAQARDLIEGEKACQGHSSRACGGGG